MVLIGAGVLALLGIFLRLRSFFKRIRKALADRRARKAAIKQARARRAEHKAARKSKTTSRPEPKPQKVAENPIAKAPIVLADSGDDLTELGVYTPHFNFTDSDSFRAAIQGVRQEQSALASEGQIVIAAQETTERPDPAFDTLAARAFTTDSDGAIATVRWDTIEQAEARIQRAQAQIDRTLAPMKRRVNPDFAALKLKELRLTFEQREKAKQERDLRQRLAQIQKQEAQLTRDIAKAERNEARLQSQLEKLKAAAQRATGDKAFDLEKKAGEITRQIETLHAKIDRAQGMTRNTEAGHVFVASNLGSFGEGILKIGMTRRAEPSDYIANLGNDSVPFPYDVHAMVYSDTAMDLRDHLWETFADHRINQTSDQGAGFFRVFLQDVAAELTRLVPDAEIASPTEAQGFRQARARKPRRWARG